MDIEATIKILTFSSIQCSGFEIINYGSRPGSSGKSRISDPGPGKYPITDPDYDPDLNYRLIKKRHRNSAKFVKVCHILDISGYRIFCI